MFVVLALTQSSFVEIEKGSTAELLFASDVDEKEGGVAIQKGLYSLRLVARLNLVVVRQ